MPDQRLPHQAGESLLGEAQLPWVVYLDPEDDIVSIRDRLDWHSGTRLVLVLPDGADLLTEYLDLVRLRRHAQALRIEVGLVTGNGRVRSQARALSYPVFRSVDDSLSNERRWRRSRKWPISARPGLRVEPDREDLAEVRQRKRPRPNSRSWLLRYLAIVAYFITLAVLLVAAVYILPGATITLEPEVIPLQVSKQLVADPQLQELADAGSSVPGRVLVTVQDWRAEVVTTGTAEVADAPAEGTVVLVNRAPQPVTAPAGTRVSTTAGPRIVFQTLAPVELPGEAGATAEVPVVAIQPGEEGNVLANQVNRVEGALGLQLDVRNLSPMSGGGARQEAAVSVADKERLRAQVLQQLQALAAAEMESQLAEGEFLARDSLRVSSVLAETYSHFPGEKTDRLTMEMRAELEATAVDQSMATGLVYGELTRALRSGFELVDDSLVFRSGRVLGVDGDGRVTFEMRAEGRATARLELADVLAAVSGQEVGRAQAYLFERLPLREYPQVRVWPAWFGRMPYLSVRVRVEVLTTG